MALSRRYSSAIFGFLLVASCSPIGKQTATQLASMASMGSTCSEFKSRLFDPIIDGLRSGDPLPDVVTVREAFLEELRLKHAHLTTFQSAELSERFSSVYMALISLVDHSQMNPDEVVRLIARIETGDQSTAALTTAQFQLQSAIEDFQSYAQSAGLNCAIAKAIRDPSSLGDFFKDIRGVSSPQVFGAHKVTAVAYQSCETLELDPLTDLTPDVEGIVVTGNHASGTGLIREISSVSSVQKSHYYLRESRLAQSTCFDVQKSPLIYDYGGKPYASTGVTGTLDLFKNSGTGSDVLGIDCSGYVFSAFASAGLKMDPDIEIKAQHVYGINAARFMNSPDSSMRCFQKAKVTATSSLKAGDVIASSGHVILVDWVGADPLGIYNLKNKTQCTAEYVDYKNFDFVVSQSSPTKSGIGIDRFYARDYLAESSTMRRGLEEFAIKACLARFDKSTLTPAPTAMSVVRHSLAAVCRTQEIALEKSSCVEKCPLRKISR